MNNNDQAFPVQAAVFGKGEDYFEAPGHTGLTKREYFAAMMAQGLLTKYSLNKPEDQQTIAKMAIELTDTIINELSKPAQ